MQLILSLVTLVAAALGLVCGVFFRWRRRSDSPPPVPPVAVFLWPAGATLLLFLLTLPAAGPFAHGLRLGWGALLGGALGIVAVARSLRARAEDGLPLAVELLSLAAAGPALLLIVFRGDPTAVLLGCALGAVLAVFTAVALLRPAQAVGEGDSLAVRGPELFALALTAATAGTRLAMSHFPRLDMTVLGRWGEVKGGYWAVPALALAVAALVMALIPRSEKPWARVGLPLVLGIAGALAIGLFGLLISVKLLPALSWRPLLYGLLALALISLAFLRIGAREEEAAARPMAPAFGAVILILVLMVLAFNDPERHAGDVGEDAAVEGRDRHHRQGPGSVRPPRHADAHRPGAHCHRPGPRLRQNARSRTRRFWRCCRNWRNSSCRSWWGRRASRSSRSRLRRQPSSPAPPP